MNQERFPHLRPHLNSDPLSKEIIEKFGIPFYMEVGGSVESGWPKKVNAIRSEISVDLCLLLLGDRNWRSRKVGAYFAAVKNYRELIDIIGTHLLKSEVCCVGHIYALVLAFFNDERCVLYLDQYLDYYLQKPELYYDQIDVLSALLYLDQENKTDLSSRHLNTWKTFSDERMQIENRNMEMLAERFSAQQSNYPEEAIHKHREERKIWLRNPFRPDIIAAQTAVLRQLND